MEKDGKASTGLVLDSFWECWRHFHIFDSIWIKWSFVWAYKAEWQCLQSLYVVSVIWWCQAKKLLEGCDIAGYWPVLYGFNFCGPGAVPAAKNTCPKYDTWHADAAFFPWRVNLVWGIPILLVGSLHVRFNFWNEYTVCYLGRWWQMTGLTSLCPLVFGMSLQLRIYQRTSWWIGKSHS